MKKERGAGALWNSNNTPIAQDALTELLASVTVPDAPLVQDENDLNPKPAALAFKLRLLEDRVSALERKDRK